MKITDEFYEFTTCLRMILWGGNKNKITVLFTYLRFFFKYMFLIRLFKMNLKQERVYTYAVEFNDYLTFLGLFKEIFIGRIYHVKTQNDQPLIIDCGSNIGMSVLYFKSIYPESKIIAFEANPESYQILKRNIENNHLKNVEAHNVAVYKEEGTISFFVDPDKQCSPVSGTTPNVLLEMGHQTKEIKVKAVQLSKFINEPIDILKLDVEAAESIVLDEISEKLEQVKTLIIDYNYSPHYLTPNNQLSKMLFLLESKKLKCVIHSTLRQELLWDSSNKPFDLIIRAYR